MSFPAIRLNSLIRLYSMPPVCGLQYVGEMGQPLHARVNSHQFDIMHQGTDVSLVAEHFNGGKHLESGMRVVLIEIPTSRDPCLQKVKEGRWNRTLETLFPFRMNLWVDRL